MIVNQQDVARGFYITVLLGIVQENDLHGACGCVCHEAFDASATVCIDSYVDVGELVLYLPRLVANYLHWCVFLCQYVSFALSLVSST